MAAFYPSLHLNLGDSLRRLGSVEAARPLADVRRAVVRHHTERLSSAPGS